MTSNFLTGSSNYFSTVSMTKYNSSTINSNGILTSSPMIQISQVEFDGFLHFQSNVADPQTTQASLLGNNADIASSN